MSSATSIERDGFRPWHFFVLASLMLATAAVIMSRRSTPEHLVLISFTIASAGAAAAGFYRMLVPLASGATASERAPLTERSRATLEREKMLVLRSIKELEFDHAMGKLSKADFEEMGGRLRARAIGLIRQLDEGNPTYRAAIEQELQKRLAGSPTCSCSAVNDPDAIFCKKCGTRLVRSAAS